MWKLITVPKTDWKQDDTGYYSLIHWIKPGVIRLDLMIDVQTPVISFQGKADDVRKAAMQHADANAYCLSSEHAAYIGSELTKADYEAMDYVQN